MVKIAASHTYSDQDILNLFRECLATISVRGAKYEINGVIYTSLDLDKVQQLVNIYQTRVDQASRGMAANLIQFAGRS